MTLLLSAFSNERANNWMTMYTSKILEYSKYSVNCIPRMKAALCAMNSASNIKEKALNSGVEFRAKRDAITKQTQSNIILV